jgi:hypothetical protein
MSEISFPTLKLIGLLRACGTFSRAIGHYFPLDAEALPGLDRSSARIILFRYIKPEPGFFP